MNGKLIKALLIAGAAMQPCMSPVIANATTVVTGDDQGAITESNEVQAVSGDLDATDNGSPVKFVPQTDMPGKQNLGKFTINANGLWTYTMNSAHDEFAEEAIFTDSIDVSTTDGISRTIAITITGTNDAAVITPTAVPLYETDEPLTAEGTLKINDVDSPNTIDSQNGTTGKYGTFSIDSQGVWTYKANEAYNSLEAGDFYTDIFDVKCADGTIIPFNIIINGTPERRRKIFNTSLNLGVQFLPDYDENGDNKGLNKTREYASLNLDSRWTVNTTFFANLLSVANAGLDVMMLGTATVDENQSSSTPTKFNEVSDTVDSSIYLQFVPRSDLFRISGGSEIGIIFRGGIITRDKKAADESTLDDYHKIGLRYTYIEGVPKDYKGVYENTFTGYFDIGYARFSDYAGGEIDRLIIDAQYKLIENTNWFIGVNANIGPGQDEFYLTTSFRADVGKLKEAFGVNGPE